MGFYEHAAELNGKKVVEFTSGQPLPDPAIHVPAIRIEYDSTVSSLELLMEVLQDPKSDQLTGLVLGMWEPEVMEEPPVELLEALFAAAPRLPHVDAIFFGDITGEENEVSWIVQGDLSAIWEAFPKLQVLKVRGSNELTLGNIAHANLRELVIQSGGLPSSVVNEISNSQLPALEHLELFLGTEDYGWDGTADTLSKIVSGELFPKLSYLGLRNSVVANEIAELVANSPILDRIDVLDLSLGTMTDEGGNALLASEKIKSVKKLLLNHHFMSTEVTEKLSALPMDVDVSDVQVADTYGDEVYRYTAISE